ncbi:DUF3054 domain-containing protein [Phytoactinopolyspora alkaliphila]|uniref:DUF3054 domain-containing protein n=2 Tax=Phytoactinopolyspora alkaliphila TaxID=1783498 RepID=A0A6N9YP45_9ACTN|nr:DUF3054 domain-containing protein [Phytoactinopolyspora alkaliphila]
MWDPRAVIVAVVADAALIGAFAALGRRTHERGVLGDYGLGLATTAWPFLAGAAVGWLITRAWTSPLRPLRSGVGIWLASVVGGMLLRAVSGQGTDPAFVVVAAATLALLLVGWRAIAFYLQSAGSAGQV